MKLKRVKKFNPTKGFRSGGIEKGLELNEISPQRAASMTEPWWLYEERETRTLIHKYASGFLSRDAL